eukprot:TRINITY_DN25939_c0_g1_i1.p1 TRINITY_DN25939_c0_g1~~TRINITY_DN25939_c0_g1_i1.p1  ORF type:complete len:885 (-),score=197.64 TRINITY_DN25939_c0_g1_i1:232-2886(-)
MSPEAEFEELCEEQSVAPIRRMPAEMTLQGSAQMSPKCSENAAHRNLALVPPSPRFSGQSNTHSLHSATTTASGNPSPVSADGCTSGKKKKWRREEVLHESTEESTDSICKHTAHTVQNRGGGCKMSKNVAEHFNLSEESTGCGQEGLRSAGEAPTLSFDDLLEQLALVHARQQAELERVLRRNEALTIQLNEPAMFVSGSLSSHSEHPAEKYMTADIPHGGSEHELSHDADVFVSLHSPSVHEKDAREPSKITEEGKNDNDATKIRLVRTKTTTSEFVPFDALRTEHPLDVYEESRYRLQDWLEENLCIRGETRRNSSKNAIHLARKRKANDEWSEEFFVKISDWKCLRQIIAYPRSPCRLAWDAAGALLIIYDLFQIPIFGVYDIKETGFTNFMGWFCMLFWTLNVPASVTVGYISEGVTIMTFDKIVMNYLKTWFIVDVLVVVPDWIFAIMAATGNADSAGEGEALKLLRIVRLARMVRLLRLLKLRKLVGGLNDLVETEYTSICVNISKMIGMMVVVNHIIGCVFFGLAIGNDNEDEPTWVREYHIEHRHWMYQYFTSFHWSIAQFTPATMHIHPQNLRERFFTVNIIVIALVGFSYVVGSISNSLAQLRNMQDGATKQFWSLRRYLKKNAVPLALSVRIEKYLEHAWQQEQERVSISNVPLMNLLSAQLKSELKSAMAVPHLSVHPLYRHLNTMSSVTIQRLADVALHRMSLARGDCVFQAGEQAVHMDIVVEGRLQYSRVVGAEICEELVDKGEDWIAEPGLWVTAFWHLGQLSALVESALLRVNSGKFAECCVLNPLACRITANYAMNYVNWFNSRPSSEHSDITQGEDVADRCHDFIHRAARKDKYRKNSLGSDGGERRDSEQSFTDLSIYNNLNQ